MTPLEQKVQELKRKIHLDLIELASMTDEEDKILFINIQGDRMCPTGNIGANVITEFEISIEEI